MGGDWGGEVEEEEDSETADDYSGGWVGDHHGEEDECAAEGSGLGGAVHAAIDVWHADDTYRGQEREETAN